MRTALIVVAVMMAGCLSAPARLPTSQPPSVTHGPSTSLFEAHGVCEASANVPDAVAGGTDVMGCSVPLETNISAAQNVRIGFSWNGTGLGQAAVWLWDNADTSVTKQYILRVAADAGGHGEATLDGKAWAAVGQPLFIVGSAGGSGIAAARSIDYHLTLNATLA